MIRFFRYLYLKLIRANDTPHKIALGFAIGVFYGLLPGLGPAAALMSAIFFKANKAASLIGAVFANTWTIIFLTPIAVKIGALIFNIDWRALNAELGALLKNFSLHNLVSNTTIYKIALPALLGYIISSFAAAILFYFISFGLIYCYKTAKKAR